MTQEQAIQEAKRMVDEFYIWGIRKEGQTLLVKECKELALISINREIELLKKIRDEATNNYTSLKANANFCNYIINPKLKDLNQIKEELLKM
jgi:hypothetical protein